MKNEKNQFNEILNTEFQTAITKFNPTKGELYKWRIETNAGPLEIDFMYGNEPWIACRFVDVDKAKRRFNLGQRLNNYSGKWNWYAFEFCPDAKLFWKVSASDAYAAGQKMIEEFFKYLYTLVVADITEKPQMVSLVANP